MTRDQLDRNDDDRLEALLAELGDDDFVLDEPPADLWGRIAADAGVPVSSGTTADAPPTLLFAAPDVPADDANVRPLGSARRARRSRRPGGNARGLPPYLLLGAAAAVVVMLVLAGLSVRGTSGAGDELAAARLTSEGLPNRNQLVGEAKLVQVDGHRQISLDLPGLPPANADYYELWVLAPDGTRLHSLGPTSGDGRYLVPDAVDTDEFPVVDVSREPPDGNPAHSGDSLVRGLLERA